MVTSGGETHISVTVNGEVLPSGENDLLVKKTDTAPVQMNGIALKDTTMPRSISEQQMPPRPPSAAMNENGESKECCANGGGGLVAGAAAIFASIKHQHYQLFGHRSPPLLGSKKVTYTWHDWLQIFAWNQLTVDRGSRNWKNIPVFLRVLVQKTGRWIFLAF